MADNNVVFKVAADFDNAIKEWEQLRDKVATTTKEYEDAQKAIEDLKIAKGEFTGVAYKSKKAIDAEKESVRKSNTEYKKREKELNQLFKVQEKNTASVKKSTKAQIQQKTATGSATSAAMELGRVVSDAPYGIRGMANNITQLVSQLGFATTAAGSFSGAMRSMWTALMGPLGVVLAITTVVSAFDFFMGANKKVGDSVSDLTSTLRGFAKVLSDDVSVSARDYLKVMKMKKDLDEDLISSTEKLKDIEEELQSIAYSKERTNNYETLLKLKKREVGLQKEIEKIYRSSADSINNYNDAKDNLSTTESGTVDSFKETISSLKKEQSALSKTSENWKWYSKKIEIYQKKIEEITGVKKKGGSKGSSKKFSPFKTKKELEIDIKDNDAAILQYEKQTQAFRLKEEMNDKLSTANTEEEKLKIKQNYQRDLLLSQIKAEKDLLLLRKSTEESVVREKTKNHIADLKRIYDKYLLELKLNTKISDAEKERLKSDATSSFFGSLTQASGEEIKSLGEIDTKYKELIKTLGVLSDAKLSALFSGFFGGGEDGSQSEVMKLTDQIQIYKELLGSVGDFIDGEYDRQMTMEQNKTNALNTELNNRLLNENLSKEERQRIQNEIGQNDEKLRVRQEAIARKKFNTEKAFNMATAITNTVVAGIGAAAGTYGGAVARIAAMTATIGAGLAQVAVIARTKFQSSSANTPINTGGGAGGAGGVGDREFNFNLVGNTQENQLLETLQGQFDRPLQAFVVSKDITTQQELDANIQGQARI